MSEGRGTPALSGARAKADVLRAAVIDSPPSHRFTENLVLRGRGVSVPTSPGSKPFPVSRRPLKRNVLAPRPADVPRAAEASVSACHPVVCSGFIVASGVFLLLGSRLRIKVFCYISSQMCKRSLPLGDILALKSPSVPEGKLASALQWLPAHCVRMGESSAEGSVWGGVRVGLGGLLGVQTVSFSAQTSRTRCK